MNTGHQHVQIVRQWSPALVLLRVSFSDRNRTHLCKSIENLLSQVVRWARSRSGRKSSGREISRNRAGEEFPPDHHFREKSCRLFLEYRTPISCEKVSRGEVRVEVERRLIASPLKRLGPRKEKASLSKV